MVDTAYSTALGAVTTGQAAVDTAQANLDAATADLAAKTGVLTTAQGAAATASTTAAAAAAALAAAASLPDLSGLDAAALAALASVAPTEYTAYVSALAAQATALNAVGVAQTAVDAAQTLVDTLTTTLDGLKDTLLGLVGDLADAVGGVLDGAPLLGVTDLGAFTRAQAGAGHAQTATGSVGCLSVLAVDVAGTCGAADVALTSTVKNALTSTLAGLTGVLDSVLSPLGISIEAPVVTLLGTTTGGGQQGLFDTATATLSALRIDLAPVTVPAAFALPAVSPLAARAAGSRAVSSRAATDVLTSRLQLTVASLTESARFAPGTTSAGGGTPTLPGDPTTPVVNPAPTSTATGSLPTTGGPVGLAIGAVVLTLGGLALRRRLHAA